MLMSAQAGVATRQQLVASGLTVAEVKAELDGRRWQCINDHVVVTHNGPLTREQQLWAVWLSAGEPAAICGLTALEQWGLRGFTTDTIHVVVPRGARPLPTPGVAACVHESRRFDAEDVWPVGRPAPITSVARSALDAATWQRMPAEAVRIVVNCVQQRLCTAEEIAVELARCPKIRHRKVLSRVLDDVAGGAHAVSELAFLAFCRRHGLPRPRLQVRTDTHGRRRYLDAVLKGPDGRLVRVEIDGGVHLTLTQRWRDTRNDNDAVIDGDVVLRFPSVAFYTDDPVALAQIRRALGCVRR